MSSASSKKVVCFFLIVFFQITEAVHVKWSGSSRFESFYQEEQNYYSSFYFNLKPQIHIIDGLFFNTRFDLINFERKEDDFWKNLLFQQRASLLSQRGFVFLYKDSSKNKKLSFPFLFPSQFYLDYELEFFKFRIGRAPYHFGLGTNYSATNSPFDLWMNITDQISFYMEYQFFYLQPSFFHQMQAFQSSLSEGILSALLQGGFKKTNWQVSFLYEYILEEDKNSFVEVYGEYQEQNWKTKLSSSYIFSENTSLSVAFEGVYHVPAKFPMDLELKAGGLIGSASFNPQYNLSLILQNRWMKTEEFNNNFSSYQIAQAQIKESFYVSPRFTLSLLKENLKLQPLFLLASSLDGKQWSYEGDLYLKYRAYKKLFFHLKGGILYQKDWTFSLLAQAAASF